jgi:hypothetical protein
MNAAAVTATHRFIAADGSVCGAGDKAYGITEAGADAAGKALDVVLNGEVLIELGGSVSANAEVESDANGCAVTLASGKSNGIVRDAGSSGDKVRMTLR